MIYEKTYPQEIADVNHWYMRRSEKLKELGFNSTHQATRTMEAERLKRIEEIRRKYEGNVNGILK